MLLDEHDLSLAWVSALGLCRRSLDSRPLAGPLDASWNRSDRAAPGRPDGRLDNDLRLRRDELHLGRFLVLQLGTLVKKPMIRDAVPEDVRTLIAERITSVEQLEILLLLRSRPDSCFDATMVSEEIRTSERSAAARLANLHERCLLARVGDDQFRYQPATDELRRATDRLAAAYAERRYTIIDLIFSKPIDNLRLYADAFRLRKDDPNG